MVTGVGSRLISTVQAAHLLGIPPRRLVDWRQSGEGPRVFRFGQRTIRYSAAEVEALMVKKLREEQEAG